CGSYTDAPGYVPFSKKIQTPLFHTVVQGFSSTASCSAACTASVPEVPMSKFMKRCIAITAVVTMLAVSDVAKDFWYSITPRTWAHINDGCGDISPCGDPMVYFSTLSNARLDAQKRLDSALDELRAHDQQAFDQIFRKYHLVLSSYGQ